MIEFPVVSDIIRLWFRITETSPAIILEEQQKKGDKVLLKRKFIPSMATVGVWIETFDFDRWGIDKKQLLEWLTMFHSEYVNELKGK